MKIGITERGDARFDLSWKNKLDSIDGAILITKYISDEFIEAVNMSIKDGHKIIVHATCTGYGGTVVEPNAPDYEHQIDQLCKLVSKGFINPSNIVLRIDPVFPTLKGLSTARKVLDYAFNTDNYHYLYGCRIRTSLVDEYKHVKKRFAEAGFNNVYQNGNPSDEQLKATADLFASYCDCTPYRIIETCAETELAKKYPLVFEPIGCVSMRDIGIMNIAMDKKVSVNPQGRSGCLCLGCKTELLQNKCRCPHQCIYCYWKD